MTGGKEQGGEGGEEEGEEGVNAGIQSKGQKKGGRWGRDVFKKERVRMCWAMGEGGWMGQHSYLHGYDELLRENDTPVLRLNDLPKPHVRTSTRRIRPSHPPRTTRLLPFRSTAR